MIVLDPGHTYELYSLVGYHVVGDDRVYEQTLGPSVTLRFVKRVGPKFPGNTPMAYSGTTLQEVLRALIHRTKYLHKQEPNWVNPVCIFLYRAALHLLEYRAAKRHKRRYKFIARIEDAPFDRFDGHIRF